MYSREDASPNYIEISKKIWKNCLSQKPYQSKLYFEPCFQTFKKMSYDNPKSDSRSILVKKREAIAAKLFYRYS